MKTTTEMQLVPIAKLVPYVNNARTHSPEQITKLRSSLREFGFINPVIIDRDFNVIAGHGRILAAKEEGIAEVPCVFADHLSEAQKKAYIIADNRMAMDAGWDEELLRVEIESLQGMDFDPLLTGFDEKELADLFGTDDEAKEDDFDVEAELEKPCFSKAGDIWRLGKHTVICGDSTDPETFRLLLRDTKVNLVCTDAPYFVKLESQSGRIANDDLEDAQAYEFLMKAFTNFKDAMAIDASIYEFYATMKARVFYDAFEDREDVCLCGCLAHIRRHIELCKEENPEYAMQGLKFIQDMYNVEYMADKQELPYEKRAELRQRLSEPILDSFELWLKNTYPKVLKRSLIGKAIAYAYSLLPRMKPYLHDGRIFIDNNRCENALRPLVISRKNMLFCGNHEAAENTAIICSLLGSCKERGVNPREWLNDVISKLPYYLAPKSDRDLKELLPDVWRK